MSDASGPERIWLEPIRNGAPYGERTWCYEDVWSDDVDGHGVEYIRADTVSEWQPIETAPKDGTPVDLWCVRVGYPGGDRVANCKFGAGVSAYWKTADGQWLAGRRFYDAEDGGTCYDPGLTDEGSTIVTHWMPLPEPPE